MCFFIWHLSSGFSIETISFSRFCVSPGGGEALGGTQKSAKKALKKREKAGKSGKKRGKSAKKSAQSQNLVIFEKIENRIDEKRKKVQNIWVLAHHVYLGRLG